MSPIPCQRPHTGKTLFVNVVISRAALGSGNLQTIFVSHIPVVVAAAAVANLGWGMIVSPQSPSEPALPSLQCVLSPSASWPYALKNSLNFAPRLLWVRHGGGFVALSDCILHLQLGSIQWLTSFFNYGCWFCCDLLTLALPGAGFWSMWSRIFSSKNSLRGLCKYFVNYVNNCWK